MITILEKGAVKFLEDAETAFDEIQSTDCNCVGREFCQIVHSGDSTPFQVEVSEATGSQIAANGGFTTDTAWTKGSGWTITGGRAVHTASGGGALESSSNINVRESTYYKIQFDIIDYSNSQTLSVLFAGDTIKTLNANGSYTVYWLTDATLTNPKIRFTPHSSTSLKIDNVSIIEMSTVSYGIKDLNDVIVKTVSDGTGVSYSGTIASVEVDWSDIEDGCYRIFLIENSINYLEDGDEGTFEDTSDPTGQPPADWGIDFVAGTTQRSNLFAKSGTYSLECEIGNQPEGFVFLWQMTTNVSVNPNSDYIIEGWVLNGANDSDFYGVQIFFEAIGINSIGVDDYEISSEAGVWNKIATSFNSGANTTITIQAKALFPNDMTDLTTLIYFDNLSIRGPIEIESECFKKGTFDCTKVLSWSNNENAYGFTYEGTGFEHQLRVKSKLWKPKYPKDKKEVFVDSAGNRRILTSRTKKEEELSISEMPEYLHDAVSIGLEHDNFYIDGVKYINEETDYDPSWRNSSMLAPVKVIVTKDSQDLSNSYC